VVTNVSPLKYKLVLSDVNGDQETAQGDLVKEEESAEVKPAPDFQGDKYFVALLFDPNQSEVTPAAAKQLFKAAVVMRQYPRSKILVEGFVDPKEEGQEALILSKNRAEAVARYLTAYHKISITRILIRARGGSDPAVSSADPDQRSKNRRVEITVK
jgi:outer membrane protein OmpA-like peptidoglycan-associated protein